MRRPRWSPDGTSLLFDEDEQYIDVMQADGSGRVEFAAGADAEWSPDGTLIAFRRWRPGTAHIELVVMHADGTDPTVIWHTPEATDIFIAWTDWGTAP